MRYLLETAKESIESAVVFLNSFISTNRVFLVGSTHDGKEIQLNLDLELDFHIRKSLVSTGIPVLSEEQPSNFTLNDSELIWVLDPIDGTTTYFRSAGPSAISLSLWKIDTPIFGVVYRIDTQQLFVGGKNIGTFCDGKRISISTELDCQGSIFATGLPSRNIAPSTLQFVEHQVLLEQAKKVRMLGSAAVSLALTAQGSIDVYSEHESMLWDVAGGLALVEGAGGKFTLEIGANFQCLVTAGHPDFFGS